MSTQKLDSIKDNALAAFKAAPSSKDLYDLKVQYLGKNGSLTEIMKEMASLSKEEKPLFGKKVNEVKQLLEGAYLEAEEALKKKEISAKMSAEELDLTLPSYTRSRGAQHPVYMVVDEIFQIMSRLGYSVRTGPLIEKDYYNFEALNIPADHPARDMQDTFFIEKNPDILLRTHTSSVQVRVMEKTQPPIRMIMPGRVFRNEAISARSHCFFHQIEGLYIDKNVSFADLKQTLLFFAKEYFGTETQIRLRPSYFPFTEPSAEMDISCTCKGKGCNLCKYTGWLEILGCGMVDPNVLDFCNIDSKTYSGFAFGMGIERIALLKYQVKDIRIYSENDIRFLRQFSSVL